MKRRWSALILLVAVLAILSRVLPAADACLVYTMKRTVTCTFCESVEEHERLRVFLGPDRSRLDNGPSRGPGSLPLPREHRERWGNPSPNIPCAGETTPGIDLPVERNW